MDFAFNTCIPTYPRALVVEEDPTQAIILVTLMQQFGLCPIGPVATAAEALQLYHYNRPELSIIGIGRSSVDLVTQLRRLDDVPVIFLAEHLDSSMYEQMRLVQPLVLLLKPYHLNELHQAVGQALELRKF
jgi:CheY-like chemotaxis protein